ncbi:MAG: penicillin acylase family protein, partial [Bacteroidetes bacterium]
FYATGYATAQDRLWQMTMIKMAASGRLAEILGRDLVPLDRYLRAVGLARYARQSYQRMAPKEKRILQRFAEGGNACVRSHKLPIEFVLAGFDPEPWKPEDCMIAFAMANYQLAANLREELSFLKVASRIGPTKAALLYPIYPDEPLPIDLASKLSVIDPGRLDRRNSRQLSKTASGLLDIQQSLVSLIEPGRAGDPETVPASNNWALAGSRTKGGKSIVANDTHLGISLPSFWDIMHLKAPGYEAAGVMIPGVPIVGLGFNGHIAWGATMMMADSQDLFLEKLRTKDGRQEYLYKGRWLPVKTRTETIAIKGAAKPENFTIQFTKHGPLLNDA